jgi:hypothetical protein
MEAVTKDLSSRPPTDPPKALQAFYGLYSPQQAQEITFYLFKAWVCQCEEKKKPYSEQEIALFLDQLIDLVAAAFQLHEGNRVSVNLQEGAGHD